ncbi:MAG: efflux RND transporter periplasmic adaptor subunit [bacterium]
MKRWIILIILVLLVSVVIIRLRTLSSQGEEKEKEFAIAQIKRGAIQVSVACTGKVVSNQDVEIKSKASGEVKKLPFDVSDFVRASDLLVELDPTDEQRNLEKAQAALEAATSQLNNARQDLAIAENQLVTTKLNIQAEISSARATWEDAENKAKREEQLFQKKLSSQEELDTRKAEAVRAKAAHEKALVKQEEFKTQEMEIELRRHAVQLEESRVRAARVDLEIARQRLQDTRILSPVNGTVTARNVQIGQIISSGINNIGGGTTILTLSDLSRIFVIASVDESDIGKVKLRQKAKITVDSYPDVHFDGQVVQIATRGVNISNVVTFDVKIEVLGKNKSLLKPEMTANVQIVSREKANVVLVPDDAVEFSSEGPKVQVVLPDGRIETRSLTLGLDNGGTAEVISGLEEGEEVRLISGQVHSKWSNTGRQKDADQEEKRPLLGLRRGSGGE